MQRAPGPASQPTSGRASEHLWALPTVLLVAGALAFDQLGVRDLWLDEATTFHRARLPIGELVDNSILKRHIPTYFLFMHPFVQLGDSEFMLRLPSALFGVGTVALMYAAGAMLSGAMAGSTAALLVGLSPLHVRYCQEARMYSMLTFAASLTLVGIVALERRPPGQRAERWPWVTIGVGTLAVLYLHNTGLFFAAALGFAGLAHGAASPGPKGPLLRRWLGVGALVALGYAPWVPKLLEQSADLEGRAWGRITYSYGRKVLSELFFMHPRPGALALAIIAVSLVGLWQLRRRPSLLAALVTLFIVGPAIFVGVSLGFKPMFGPRLLLWTALPFALAGGVGVAAIGPRPLGAAVGIGLLAWIGVTNAGRYHPKEEIPWRSIATQLRDAQAADDGALLIFGLPARTLQYYFERRSDPIGPVHYTTAPRKPMRNLSRFMYRHAKAHRTVWLVAREDRDGFHAQAAIDWLDARGERFHFEEHGRARIFGYRLR